MRFAVLAVLLLFLPLARAQTPEQQPAPAPPAGQQPYSPETENSPYQAPPGAVALPKDYRPEPPVHQRDGQGSAYLPYDSWVYPALDRLEAFGFLDRAFLGLRPWTRLAILHLLEESSDQVQQARGPAGEQAQEIFLAIQKELAPDLGFAGKHAELDTVYSESLGITDTPLNDSYHLGQTIYNNYGRPFQAGFNNYSGASGRFEAGRFTLAVRGEYRHAPSALGYSASLGQFLSETVDFIPFNSVPRQATLPVGPLASVNQFRLVEANLSYHLLNHEVSFGRTDHWWGPGVGGAYGWSNNAQNPYAFEINRVEPLYIPGFSRFLGPIRYDFFVGSLQGHTAVEHPYFHSEKISLHPTGNLELGFERTVIWGGLGHEPITVHTFLRSFFSSAGVDAPTKFSDRDPGARFSAFDFNYRLPFVRNWLTLYTDSFAHDDVLPISAPRRAAIRPGIFLSHVPLIPALDFRVEAASTDPPTSRSSGGRFLMYEAVAQQGLTNSGFLFSDAIGREDKGGQAWLTYHLSPAEQVRLSYRNVKAAKDFISGGTTQNQYTLDLVKRVGRTFDQDIELHAYAQYERWRAPIYRPGLNTDVSIWGGLTWFPRKSKQF